MTNNATPFGTTADGKQESLVTLTNAAGLEASFSDYGATWVSMITPDRADQLAGVLIGFDDVTGYETQPFISSVVGRYANRISQGSFTLDGIQYQLDRNEEAHHLHGEEGRQGHDGGLAGEFDQLAFSLRVRRRLLPVIDQGELEPLVHVVDRRVDVALKQQLRIGHLHCLVCGFGLQDRLGTDAKRVCYAGDFGSHRLQQAPPALFRILLHVESLPGGLFIGDLR